MRFLLDKLIFWGGVFSYYFNLMFYLDSSIYYSWLYY